jgi:hypothetical protein
MSPELAHRLDGRRFPLMETTVEGRRHPLLLGAIAAPAGAM